MSKPRRRGSDADLKAIAARSEQHAMDLVVQRYRQRLQWHALCIVKDRQEAADAVQDVFIKAMKERRFWEDEFEIRAWLFRVTTNLCYNIVRAKKRRSGILAAMPEEQVDELMQMVADEHGLKMSDVFKTASGATPSMVRMPTPLSHPARRPRPPASSS